MKIDLQNIFVIRQGDIVVLKVDPKFVPKVSPDILSSEQTILVHHITEVVTCFGGSEYPPMNYHLRSQVGIRNLMLFFNAAL